MPKLMQAGKLALEIVAKYHNSGISKAELGRILYKENPTVFKNPEHARNIIRQRTGSSGDWLREKSRHIMPLNDTTSILNSAAEREPEQYTQAKKRKLNKNSKYFLITWGQCNTKVHKGFFNNMKAYAKFLGADIHVILGRYKNPNSLHFTGDDEFWVDDIVPYMDANRHNIHKYLTVLSDIRVQPTAVNPMSGLQGVSGMSSCILGHPRVQMELVPVLEGNAPKMMLTTGACTLINYTDSKAGKKGQFHHTYGFCVVEIKNNEVFFVRQVTASTTTGDFTDLYFRVEDGKVKKVDKVAAAIIGDLHSGRENKKKMEATHRLLGRLKPDNVVLHDTFNGLSIMHHTQKDAFMQYGMEMNGTNDLGAEIEQMYKVVSKFLKYKKVAIVRSNHDDFLDRWLKGEDWRKTPTPKNFKLYMEFGKILLEQYEKNPDKVSGVIAHLLKKKFPKLITLGRTDTFKVLGWELSQHGDVGANGSRGSINQFRKISTKIVTADSHSPARKDGALVAGTSSNLRMGYNTGASGWLHSDVLISEQGKAQHITYIEGEYTTLK